MIPQKSYPAGQIEPGWHVSIGEQWFVVGIVFESEVPDGTRYITIVFEGATLPVVRFLKAQMVSARPPHHPPTSESVA